MPDPMETPFTMSARIGVNTSPFAGTEGKQLTNRMIYHRLHSEASSNPTIRVNETDSAEVFEVFFHEESQFAQLVKAMRQEGFELTISKFLILFREDEDNPATLLEPYAEIVMDVPTDCTGKLLEEMVRRQGSLIDLSEVDGEMTRAVYHAPYRFLIGFRQDFLNITRGFGTLNKSFLRYAAAAPITWEKDRKGCLISSETGEAVGYALSKLQDRGTFFIKPNDKVYTGMIIGENTKNEDLEVNALKGKLLTNMRASGSDDAYNLEPPRDMGLAEMIDYIRHDECIEVTPIALRLRKIVLDPIARKADGRNRPQAPFKLIRE